MWSSDFVGTQCIHASDGTTCQVAYFGYKVIFSVSDVSERFKESISRFPANFKKVSESRIFDLSRDPTSHIELKLTFSKTCSDSFNMGRVCSVLMPVVTLQSFKMIGRLKMG